MTPNTPFLRTPRTFHATPTQSQWEREWTETIGALKRLLTLCEGAKEAEAELHDAANSSIAGGSVSLGRSASPTSATHELGISDMTGATAVSPQHQYMRRQLGLAGAELPELRRRIKRLRDHADKIEGILKRAIPSALDSEFREQLDHQEETAAGYRARHRRPA